MAKKKAATKREKKAKEKKTASKKKAAAKRKTTRATTGASRRRYAKWKPGDAVVVDLAFTARVTYVPEGDLLDEIRELDYADAEQALEMLKETSVDNIVESVSVDGVYSASNDDEQLLSREDIALNLQYRIEKMVEPIARISGRPVEEILREIIAPE